MWFYTCMQNTFLFTLTEKLNLPKHEKFQSCPETEKVQIKRKICTLPASTS